VSEAFDLEAALTRAYAYSVGVEMGSLDALVAEVRAAMAAGDPARAALEARRSALRRAEVRCIVSRVQAAFLGRVLAE
jgi:hypothetical protein